MEKTRQIFDINISFISLVKAGANRRSIVWKADAKGNVHADKVLPILKTDEEQRIVYGVVYAPNEVDTWGDWATAKDIQKAAYSFMQNLRAQNVDSEHDFIAKNAYVAESFILRGEDPMFPGEKPGTWVVAIKVDDPDLWEKVKTGELGGISMAGLAKTEPEKTELEKAQTFSSALFGEQIWPMTGALNDALRSIMDDESVLDKTSQVSQAIDEFKAACMGLLSAPQEQPQQAQPPQVPQPQGVMKQERGFTAWLKKFKGGKPAAKQKEVEEMDEKAIAKAISEAMAPHFDKLEGLLKSATAQPQQDPKPQEKVVAKAEGQDKEPTTEEKILKSIESLDSRLKNLEGQAPESSQGTKEFTKGEQDEGHYLLDLQDKI